MSVDLEDYYCDLPFNEWGKYEERVKKITRKILNLFEENNVNATFFTLGYIAEKYPELIEEIQSKGHEIASHGYHHLDLRKITKSDFENDLKKSIDILERISNEKIIGFRAPFFSINKKNLWVFEILEKYMKYDSSIFPVKTPLYGIPDAIHYHHKISSENPLEENKDGTLLEIPPLVIKTPFGNIPAAGGFHLRFFPIQMMNFAINKMNKKGFPATCYIHPKDFDEDMPRIKEYNWYYYWGLKNSFQKFESLIKKFEFSSVRDTLIE